MTQDSPRVTAPCPSCGDMVETPVAGDHWNIPPLANDVLKPHMEKGCDLAKLYGALGRTALEIRRLSLNITIFPKE